MIKTIKISISLILIVLFTGCHHNKSDIDDEEVLTTSVVTTKIQAIDIIRFHEVPAVLAAKNRAQLSFQLSGTINEVRANIGQEVKKGQPLMGLYNPDLNPNLSVNLARKESIKAQITQVKRDLSDIQALRKTFSASQTELERKQSEYHDLLAQDKSIQAQIDQARANQGESIITAPFDGVVVRQDKQLGEFVQAGQIAMVLFQQQSLEVEVNITQVLWQNLKLNDVVSGAYGQQPLEFIVTELSKSADAQSHLMKVILDLRTPIVNAIGQSVTINFPQIYSSVYQLPLESVVDDGINQPYVFVESNAKAFKNPIEPLFIEGQTVIFRSDQEIKDRVVIKGQSRISKGTRLKELS